MAWPLNLGSGQRPGEIHGCSRWAGESDTFSVPLSCFHRHTSRTGQPEILVLHGLSQHPMAFPAMSPSTTSTWRWNSSSFPSTVPLLALVFCLSSVIFFRRLSMLMFDLAFFFCSLQHLGVKVHMQHVFLLLHAIVSVWLTGWSGGSCLGSEDGEARGGTHGSRTQQCPHNCHHALASNNGA